jgi:hypothetical protein
VLAKDDLVRENNLKAARRISVNFAQGLAMKVMQKMLDAN